MFGIYLSAGVGVALVAGVAGVAPGSPLRALLTAPARSPSMLEPPPQNDAPRDEAPRSDASPGDPPRMEGPAPEPANSQQEIAVTPRVPLSLAQATSGERSETPEAPAVVATALAAAASAGPGPAAWSIQIGAFHGRSEAVHAATTARRRIGAGQPLVTERLGTESRGRNDTIYLAQLGGLTVPQARAACGAGSDCLIFAPTEPVAPDLLPPDPPPPGVSHPDGGPGR